MSDATTVRDGRQVIPTSAWVLAWSFVVGQVLELVQRGPQEESAWPLSILLSVALVVFFAHGVMRARPIRFWIVAALLVLALVLGVVGLVVDPSGWGLVDVALSGVQVAALHSFRRSPWFAWQRTRPDGGPSLAAILALAVVVGVLGGVLGAESADTQFTVHVGT